jgi:hypothetical protein
VLNTLRAGRGPDWAFRVYLLTAPHHVACDKTRRDHKTELANDATPLRCQESPSDAVNTE